MGAIQTSQRELEAFYALALPGFLEYLRTHGTSVGNVELATTLEGITSLPARYMLGGVEKTVLAPLSLLTKEVDAQIIACIEATTAANSAASDANAKVEDMTSIQGDIEQAVADAQKAVEDTQNNLTKLESRIEEINTSEESRETAEAERETAESTRQTEFAALKSEMETAISEAETATENANDTADHPTYIGEDNYVYKWDKASQTYNKTDIYVKGDAFNIEKVWASVDAMNADTTVYKEGAFGLINTGDVEQEDNAKLYVYQDGAWEFLVDMSGAIGFTGKTPQITIGTVSKGDNAAATLTDNGTDTSGNPKYNLNLVLPKGDKGDKGEKGDTGETGATGAKGDKGDKGDALTWDTMTDAERTEIAESVGDAIGADIQGAITNANEAATAASDAATEANEKIEEINEMKAVIVTAEDEGEVIDAMETLTTDALRKTAQILTDAEKAQARTNIGAVGTTELATKQDVIGDLDSIRSGAAKGATALQSYTEKYTGTYNKPSTGIPKSDLASDVQTSLGKADTALQSHQDISGKLDKAVAESTYLSKTDAASTYQPKGDYATNTALAEKQDKIPVTDHGTGDTTFELTPNVLHVWGEVGTLTLTLGAVEDETVYNEYMFQFTSGETATTLSLPDTIQWVSTPSVEAGYTYQCSIVNNIGVIASVANS